MIAESLGKEILAALSLGLILFQGTASAILLSRLLKGAKRRPPSRTEKRHARFIGDG